MPTPDSIGVLADPDTQWLRVTVSDWCGEPEGEVEITSNPDAASGWYHPGLPAAPIRWVLVRDPQGKFRPQALLCTEGSVAPPQILAWFVLRWQLEVTFEEVRAHLGVETQRQWAGLAIARTTPALLGLFSLVTVLAGSLKGQGELPVQQAAWYTKGQPTFSDALGVVRRYLWGQAHLYMSPTQTETVNIPRSLWERLTETLCYAA